MLLYQCPLLCKQNEVISGEIKLSYAKEENGSDIHVGSEINPAFCSFSNLVN